MRKNIKKGILCGGIVCGVLLMGGVMAINEPSSVTAAINRSVMNNMVTDNYVSDASAKTDYIKYWDSKANVGTNGSRTVTFNASFDMTENNSVEFVYAQPFWTETGFNAQRAVITVSDEADTNNYVEFTYYAKIESASASDGQFWWSNAYIDGEKLDYELKPTNSGVGNVCPIDVSDGVRLAFKFDRTEIISSYFASDSADGYGGMFGSLTTEKAMFQEVFENTERITISIKMSHFDGTWGGTNGTYTGGWSQICLFSVGGQSLASEATDVLAPYASALTLKNTEYLQNAEYTFGALTTDTDLYVESANDLWSAKNLTYTLTVKDPTGAESTTEAAAISEQTKLTFIKSGVHTIKATVYDEAGNSYITNTVETDVKAVYNVQVDGVSNTVKEGETFTLPTNAATNFIGYVKDNALYFAGEEVEITADCAFVSQSLTITAGEPTVRYEREPYGLRFTSTIDETEYLAIKELASVSFGTVILPENMVEATGGLTLENSNVLHIAATHIEDDYLTINAVVTEMNKTAQYQRRLSAAAYVKVERNGVVRYFYYTPVTYSLEEVASAMIAAGGLSEEAVAILNTFITEGN